jgi:putative transcriptional regulator
VVQKDGLFQREEPVEMSVNSTRRLIKMKSKTNWTKVKKMTEEEIIAAAKEDPDALPLTANELQQFTRVSSREEVDVKAMRQKLHLSQKKFANYFGVSVRTIQEWEQHRCYPSATARNFMKVIAQAPEIVRKALATYSL